MVSEVETTIKINKRDDVIRQGDRTWLCRVNMDRSLEGCHPHLLATPSA